MIKKIDAENLYKGDKYSIIEKGECGNYFFATDYSKLLKNKLGLNFLNQTNKEEVVSEFVDNIKQIKDEVFKNVTFSGVFNSKENLEDFNTAQEKRHQYLREQISLLLIDLIIKNLENKHLIDAIRSNVENIKKRILEKEKYELMPIIIKIETIDKLIKNIPEHVFSGVDKREFLEFIESVFLKIENVDEIHISAAVSFLKLKFMSGITDIDSAVIMIKNQCRK